MIEIPENISIKELLLNYLPKKFSEMGASSGSSGLDGTQFSLVFEISDEKYSYVIKDGKSVDATESDTDAPNIRVKVSKEDLEKMIKTKNMDMITGLQSDLSSGKVECILKLKGSLVALLSNDDGSKFKIEAIFNDAQQPQATFMMKTADSNALVRKEQSPVNLFMSGAMKIDGDMGFAMATQPLFT